MPPIAVQAGAPARRRLRDFRPDGYNKGRPRLVQAIWFATSNVAFSRWWFPARWRPPILRLFGAKVGRGVLIRHRVRIHWPWKLSIGDDSWIGEGAWLLDLEPIEIADNVCVSQEALLCTGSHDHTSATFAYDNGPILVQSGAWIGARAIVLRGVVVGAGAVIGAGSVVRRNIPAAAVSVSEA